MSSERVGNQRLGRLRRFSEYALVTALLIVLLAAVGILNFRRYQPAQGVSTIDQLVARLPETLKFAVVEQGSRTYVVWVGRPRGVIASGPPVYVFDRAGTLVDRVYDTGESDNSFVKELHVRAFHAPAITPREAVNYCREAREHAR